jgi:hypothetical protein
VLPDSEIVTGPDGDTWAEIPDHFDHDEVEVLLGEGDG